MRVSNLMKTFSPVVSVKGLWSFVLRLMRKQSSRFIFIYILSTAWAIESTVWPYLLRLIIDRLTRFDLNRAQAWGFLKWFVLAGIIFWIANEFFQRLRDFLRARAFPQLEADIRMEMFDHIQRHSPKYFNEHFAGSLSNKISDMTTQVTSILQTITVFISALVSTILTFLFFSKVNPIFAGILVLWIGIHFTICFYFTRKCVEFSTVHGKARSKLAGKIVDSFTNNFAVNLFFRFSFEKSLIGIYQKIERKANYQTQYYSALMQSVLSVLFLTGIITLNAVLLLYWTKYRISTGEVVQVFNTTFNVSLILWVTSDIMPQFFKSVGIAKQALSVMHAPKDIMDPPHAQPLIISKGEITFENVSFQYNETGLFREKNVHIKGGEKVGLVGYSGAGKSTFINLILRFYPIDKGKILIDGQDIATSTLESLRKQITLIPQDSLLFHRSLKDNIGYGNPEASETKIREAAHLAHCDEFIKKCPDGYETLVGERGTKLSGGERQRIAIARAMLTTSPILILDEATSSLDSITEQLIQESLEHLMSNRTTIVVAHRLATLSKMDRILVFDQGQIVEEGCHKELIEKGGHYAHMWQMQAGGFLPKAPT